MRLAQHGPIECEAEAAPSPLAQLQAAREAAHMEATAAILSGKDPGNHLASDVDSASDIA